MQYVKCIFPSSPHREYTYTNNGEPLSVGSFVDVETRNGVQTVEVVGTSDTPPDLPAHVQLKSILGPSQASGEY